MNTKIANITVLMGKETRTYSVGTRIKEIRYAGMSYETHTDDIYQIYDHDDKAVAEIINCPVVVEFY